MYSISLPSFSFKSTNEYRELQGLMYEHLPLSLCHFYSAHYQIQHLLWNR